MHTGMASLSCLCPWSCVIPAAGYVFVVCDVRAMLSCCYVVMAVSVFKLYIKSSEQLCRANQQPATCLAYNWPVVRSALNPLLERVRMHA